MPSLKYSCSGSPLMLAKGSMTIEGLSGRQAAVRGRGLGASGLRSLGEEKRNSEGYDVAATSTSPPAATRERWAIRLESFRRCTWSSGASPWWLGKKSIDPESLGNIL